MNKWGQALVIVVAAVALAAAILLMNALGIGE